MVGLLAVLAVATGVALHASDATTNVAEFMDRLGAFGFRGAFIAAEAGTIACRSAYGGAGEAIEIGSNTKAFTKISIWKLAQAGKLKLDDTLSTFFEGVPSDKAAITVQQILQHRAGLALYAGPDTEPVSRGQMVQRVLSAPLVAQPGGDPRYSNAGYNLLAAIVELRSQLTFQQYLAAHVFAPASLTRTFDDAGERWNLRGSGGLVSTLEDMLHFYAALQNERIVSNDLQSQIVPLDRFVMIAGGNGIHEFIYSRDPGTKIEMLVASTEPEMTAEAVHRELVRVVRGSLERMPPRTLASEPARLQAYVGRYALGADSEIRIEAHTGGLVLKPMGQAAVNAAIEPVPSDLAARLNERAAAILRSSLTGDYVPWQQARGDDTSVEQIRALQERMWAQRRQRLGAFRSLRVLGTVPAPPDEDDGPGAARRHRTVVELQFENGSAFVEFLWGPRGFLNGVDPRDGGLEVPYRLESPSGFATYNLNTGATRRIAFAKAGATLALVIDGREYSRSPARR